MTRAWLGTVIVVVIFAAGIDRLVAHLAHPVFWWHTIPAFEVLYGLFGFVVLGLGGSKLGSVCLQRPSDYYTRDQS